MKKINLILLFWLLLVGFVYAGDWSPIKNRVLYTGTTDKPVNMAWGSNNSNHYSVQVWIPYRLVDGVPDGDTLVEYQIYDGQALIHTRVIDQSLEKYRDKWVSITTFAHSISSGNLRVVMTADDVTKYAAAAAVRITTNPCEDPNTGTRILVGGSGTSSTGVWTDADTYYSGFYGLEIPQQSRGGSTYTWVFSNVSPPVTDISYEVYIKHFPSDSIYAFSNTSRCGIPIMLPKTGHYSAYVRTLKDCFESTELDGKTFEELVALINEVDSKWVGALFYLDHGLATNVTELKLKMLRACGASAWVSSIIAEQAMVDCEHKAWWIYGYPAPPGPIGFD